MPSYVRRVRNYPVRRSTYAPRVARGGRRPYVRRMAQRMYPVARRTVRQYRR